MLRFFYGVGQRRCFGAYFLFACVGVPGILGYHSSAVFRYRWYLVGDHSFRGTGGYRFGGLSAGQAAALPLLKAAAENVSHETFVLFETDNYPKENLRDR